MTTPVPPAVPVIVRLPEPVAGSGQEAAASVAAIADAAAAAAALGAAAVVIPAARGASALEPTVLAGALSLDHPGPAVLVEARTSDHAPFNLARRVQTLARLTGGRAGLYLRDTGADPVTVASRPHLAGTASVGGEYLGVLRRLWRSFPEEALIGDRDAGVFAAPELLAPARHEGEAFGVAGALNVPFAPGQQPVLLADADAAGDGAAVDGVVVEADGAASGPARTYRALAWRRSPDGETRLEGDATGALDGVLLSIDVAPFAEGLAAAFAEISALAPASAHTAHDLRLETEYA